MTNERAATWIREALEECDQLGKLSTQPYFRLPVFREALAKAITALEHSPRIPEASELDDVPPEVAEVTGLECNVCHWRTLDTHRLLCDSCGGHELKPVYEVGK
jgi:hypothetical protein